MTLRVKAGTPEGVHSNIPGTNEKENVREFDESEERSRPTNVITPKKVRGLEVIAGSMREVITERDTTCVNKVDLGYNHGREGLPWGDEHFTNPMGKALTGETNQGNPFDIPAAGSTKPRTLSEAMAELVFRFKILMVEIWMPEGYEVVQKQPLVDVKQFIAEARALWDSYEPLLGVHNAVTVLQVEAPPEEDETNG